MHVGIIVHSQSGNTALFAKAICDHLRNAGIETSIELLRVSGSIKLRSSQVSLRNNPEVHEYDTLLFGCPVWGFAPSPAILSYLNMLDSLKGKKALPFATHGLPFKSFGANQALRKMKACLEILQAEVLDGESLHCLFKPNKTKMEAAAERILARIK